MHNKPHTEEAKKKMSKALIGRKLSDEHRKNIGKAVLGRKHSEKSKRKMSRQRMGSGNPMWKRNISKEHREKLKLSHSKEFYKRISLLGVQKQWNSKKLREKTLRGMQKRWLSKEPTSIEKIVYDFLKTKGIIFEKQKLINGKFLVDVYIPDLNLVIECDGDYWHGLDRVKKKDKAENAYLKKCGFNLLRFSGTEIRNDSFKERLVI